MSDAARAKADQCRHLHGPGPFACVPCMDAYAAEQTAALRALVGKLAEEHRLTEHVCKPFPKKPQPCETCGEVAALLADAEQAGEP